MRVADTVRRLCHIFFYEGENFTLMSWVILSLRKLLQTTMNWQNRLSLTLTFLTFHLFFLTVYNGFSGLTRNHFMFSLYSIFLLDCK